MTVGDLKKILSYLDDNLPVLAPAYENGWNDLEEAKMIYFQPHPEEKWVWGFGICSYREQWERDEVGCGDYIEASSGTYALALGKAR